MEDDLNILYIRHIKESLESRESIDVPYEAKVLLSLSQAALDRARVLAGRATITLKLPVSLQIVLRALIGEGLEGAASPRFLADIESQAKTVRQRRRVAGRPGAHREPRS